MENKKTLHQEMQELNFAFTDFIMAICESLYVDKILDKLTKFLYKLYNLKAKNVRK